MFYLFIHILNTLKSYKSFIFVVRSMSPMEIELEHDVRFSKTPRLNILIKIVTEAHTECRRKNSSSELILNNSHS